MKNSYSIPKNTEVCMRGGERNDAVKKQKATKPLILKKCDRKDTSLLLTLTFRET